MCNICRWLKRGPHVELLSVHTIGQDDGTLEVRSDWLIAPNRTGYTRTESCVELITEDVEKADRHQRQLSIGIGMTRNLR